jgi:Cellulase (glycosyl hydrolase family 5)
MLSQAAEARAAQLRIESRVARQARAAERVSEEQTIHAVTLQQQEHLQAAAVWEAQRLQKQREAEARQQREAKSHAAILQKKEQRQQVAAAKLDEDALILRRKAEQREKETARPTEVEPVLREPATPAAKPVRVEPEPLVPVDKRSTGDDGNRRREEEELRAANAKQQRMNQEQQRASQRESLEAAAAMRQDERRESKRQAAMQAQLESKKLVERAIPVERKERISVEPEPSLGEEERQKPAPALSLAPRAISGGSTARAVTAAISAQAPVETTPYVQTRGSFIIDQNGDAVTLRGITVRGLDTVALQGGQTVPGALSLDASNLATITDQWGANLVRLPFAAASVLNGNGSLGASDLLAGLDLSVAAITGAGAYVLLALEAAGGAGPSDAGTLQVWQTLAARYQGEPRVFYEVFASSSPIAGDWTTEFGTVIATIRQLDPAALIFLPGSASGLDVTNVPLRDDSGDPVSNLVYTIAVSVQSVPNPEVLSAVSSVYPVFASVWADDGSDLGRQASRIADLFERCGIGWAAANWNSDPRLVMDAGGGDFTPTIWGNVVLRAIKLTAPPLLEPADAPASLATVRAAGPKLSRLSTSGNFILNDSGRAIGLRGVTVAGLDTVAPASGQIPTDALSLDENNLALMTGIWGLNLVRLPFQSQTVLTGNGTVPAGKILAALDLAVTLISEAGAYVLLALEAAPSTSLPDAATLQAWQLLAKRYKDEPGVLYEIFASTEPLATGWLQAALSLIGTIRSQNTAAMIFVNTGNSGDFTGLPLLLPTGDPIYNVVYTVNVSPQNSPGPDDGPLASFADLYPVFASTWSDDATNPSRVSPYVGDFFSRHSIGYAAANWNADPRLVTDALNHDFASTSWGLIAGRAATLPVRQMLERFGK